MVTDMISYLFFESLVTMDQLLVNETIKTVKWWFSTFHYDSNIYFGFMQVLAIPYN